MFRTSNFDEDLSRNMRDPEFARGFFLLQMNFPDEDPMTIEETLIFTIKSIGTTDFANLVGERKQSIDKFLKGVRKPKRETLDKFLKPFGLKTVLSVEEVA
ncbi:MAG: XRE family transcriptional regulator [Deltaproteobacteria bacterium]|nr:MAG: XRE family transcriptional regulator [Deltaproteobacteria bacterium]